MIIDPHERKDSRVMIEKTTLGIGSVCIVLGVVMGLAFDVGGKSNSIDSLTSEVKSMHSSLDTLTKQVIDSDKSNAVDIGQLKLEYKNLSEKVDSIMTRLEYDEAGGHRH